MGQDLFSILFLIHFALVSAVIVVVEITMVSSTIWVLQLTSVRSERLLEAVGALTKSKRINLFPSIHYRVGEDYVHAENDSSLDDDYVSRQSEALRNSYACSAVCRWCPMRHHRGAGASACTCWSGISGVLFGSAYSSTRNGA